MRGTARRRPVVTATAGILLASGLGLALPSPAQADTQSTVTSTSASVLPGSWRFDNSTTSLASARAAIGSNLVARAGFTGKGVGVALVDTGVVPVPGLASSHVKLGPDLSFESQAPNLRYLDTFGHGTHMAGIIVGNDPSARFQGVAPDAELTSVKVGISNGAVDVSQVIAAIDWVVEHRNDDPHNPIRVLNLSYGTDGHQDYTSDPLTHAVENAWRAGIVVVTAAGNRGVNGALSDPAYDPYVLTVGAADLNGTVPALDDTVTDFSSRGSDARRVDLVAPGKSIASLRDPGSYVDAGNPSARVDGGLFKGSGTSQAAAFVSGAVAQLLQQRPGLTPDQVKALLKKTATPLPFADAAGRGAGELNVLAASLLPGQAAGGRQSYPVSQGTGSLEDARGTLHLSHGKSVLTGEKDIFGHPWLAGEWAAASSAGTAWDGGKWRDYQWTGDDWSALHGAPWDGSVWDGSVWDGSVWDGSVWDGSVWDGSVWDGSVWDGSVWDGSVWDGSVWDGYWS